MSGGLVLIVSQMYHEHHVYVAEEGENFLPRARLLAIELLDHKRGGEIPHRPDYLGDLEERHAYARDRKLKTRLNVNDSSGDLYFLRSDTMQGLLDELREFQLRTSVDAIDPESLRTLRERHDVDDISGIVQKHFPFR